MNKYTTLKPTEPGWYWCYNPIDNSEFICRIDRSGTITESGATESGLVCSWMTAPGEAGLRHESEWAESTQWCGPIHTPGHVTVPTAGEELPGIGLPIEYGVTLVKLSGEESPTLRWQQWAAAAEFGEREVRDGHATGFRVFSECVA